MASLNNSVLMEIFNIACWGPLGAFDGLLLKIGIYESWSDGTKGCVCVVRGGGGMLSCK